MAGPQGPFYTLSNKERGMMNLSAAMNRHVVGVSAILATLVVLGGYASNTAPARPVASLPEESFAAAQQAPTDTTKAYESARRLEESLGQKLKEQIKALAPSVGWNSAQTESANWSREEWQIAEKAVADHRSNSKAGTINNTSARSDLVWQPPEEISGRQANPSR
jgi:hypothetical protein